MPAFAGMTSKATKQFSYMGSELIKERCCRRR